LGGEKANLFADIRRRDEDPVDGVDDAVLSFLKIVSFRSSALKFIEILTKLTATTLL
jgi:hypothetical protein